MKKEKQVGFKKQVNITLGYYKGERIRHVETVYSKEDERKVRVFFDNTENKENAFKLKLQKKGYIIDESASSTPIYFADYAIKTMVDICNRKMLSGSIKDATRIGYLSDLRYMLNYFKDDKNLEIDKVTVSDIQEFLNEFAKNHSKVSMTNNVRILKWVFIKAYDDRLIDIEIMKDKNLIIPYGICKKKDTVNEGEIKIFSDYELNKLREVFSGNILLSTFALVLEKAGLRVSEACALKVDDIDFKNKNLKVERAFVNIKREGDKEVVAIKKQYIIGKTKSGNIRTIDIPDILLIQIRKYLTETDKDDIIRKTREKTGFLFISEKGETYNRDKMRNKFSWKLKKEGCKIKFYHHCYRHTYGTKLAESGIEPKLLQYYMGHTKITITYDYYITVTDKMREKGKEILENWG